MGRFTWRTVTKEGFERLLEDRETAVVALKQIMKQTGDKRSWWYEIAANAVKELDRD